MNNLIFEFIDDPFNPEIRAIKIHGFKDNDQVLSFMMDLQEAGIVNKLGECQ